MTLARPTHLAEALRRPGYLLSAWPWRVLAYLITTVPVAGTLGIGLLVFAAPLLAVVNAVKRGRPVELPIVVFLTVVALAIVALAPIVSVAVTAVERWRLGIVDPRPLSRQRWQGLAARYTTAGAWREVAYLVWLGGVVPLVYWLLVLITLLDLALVASPWLVSSTDQMVVIWATVDTPRQAIPYAILGALLLPALWYLISLFALAQATVARWLLGWPTNGSTLREVTRSRARLVDAYETERRRIERDVHDGAQPRLTSLTLQLGLAKLDVPDESPAARPLAIAHDQAKGLMVMLREIVHGIRPQSLTELGLAGAVRELADGATVPVTVHADLRQPLAEIVETTAYFVVSEALGNVARHADATRAQVRLVATGRELVVEVEDDGRGGADPDRGTGLIGLADRVGAVDGRLLLSSPVGGPTLVRVELPCRT